MNDLRIIYKQDQPKGAELTTKTINTVDSIVVETKTEEQLPPRRSPIKPITIRTSQVTPTREHRSHHHHHRSSHRSSSHKKHKKKKKRKRTSDSEEDESEYSDPDFLV